MSRRVIEKGSKFGLRIRLKPMRLPGHSLSLRRLQPSSPGPPSASRRGRVWDESVA